MWRAPCKSALAEGQPSLKELKWKWNGESIFNGPRFLYSYSFKAVALLDLILPLGLFNNTNITAKKHIIL